MAKGFYRQLIKILKANDCSFVREGNGDHEIWTSPKTAINFTVDRSILSRHTANGVLKQAGIKKKL